MKTGDLTMGVSVLVVYRKIFNRFGRTLEVNGDNVHVCCPETLDHVLIGRDIDIIILRDGLNMSDFDHNQQVLLYAAMHKSSHKTIIEF